MAQKIEEQRAAPAECPIRAAPQQARSQFSLMALDTGVGMPVSNGIGGFIVLNTALALHASGIRDVDTAAQAAQALARP